jgi:carboxylesterase
MKVKLPEAFYFDESSDFAVLLLHGFTGNTSDVRQLGRFLQKKGITSYSFNYEGHAETPENILESSPHIWYKQVLEAHDYLKEQGYDKIFAAGVSLGGTFALRLAADRELIGLTTICSPMFIKEHEALMEGYITYARTFKRRFEDKDEATIEREIKASLNDREDMLQDLNTAISAGKDVLDDVFNPVFVAQGVKDEVINTESADIIYEGISTEEDNKELKWYENSGHVLTIDNDKQELFDDLYRFMMKHQNN